MKHSVIVLILIMTLQVTQCASAQTINPAYASQMTLSFVVSNDPPGNVPFMGNITQMAMHPNGQQLFVASYDLGIVRFNYSISLTTGVTSLTNATLIWRNQISDFGISGSLGLAFHQDPLLGTVL